jgi:hypothetical protein
MAAVASHIIRGIRKLKLVVDRSQGINATLYSLVDMETGEAIKGMHDCSVTWREGMVTPVIEVKLYLEDIELIPGENTKGFF